MDKEQEQKLIKNHSDFLLDEVIIPTFTSAFQMGWTHGAKHAREERSELEDTITIGDVQLSRLKDYSCEVEQEREQALNRSWWSGIPYPPGAGTIDMSKGPEGLEGRLKEEYEERDRFNKQLDAKKSSIWWPADFPDMTEKENHPHPGDGHTTP